MNWAGFCWAVFWRRAKSEVTDFEFVLSEHRRGAIYDLGLREQLAFGKRVARLRRKSGPQPVGFFRTHVRRGLFLDQDDFSLMGEAFSDPSQIAMLIRPVEPGPSNAGIFLWEDGDIDRRQPPLLFPFDSETLRAQGPIALPFDPLPMMARPSVSPSTITPVQLRLPAIPIRWIGWGAAVGAGAIALSAALPHWHAPNPNPEPVRISRKAQRRTVARVENPTPVTIAAAQPAPEPEAAQEPAPFVPTKPDEGQAAEEPTGRTAKPFIAPRPLPERPAEPKQVAFVAPPSLPAPRLAPEPEPTPALPDTPPAITRQQPRLAPRVRAIRVAVNIEPRESSGIRRVASHVPLIGHLPGLHEEGGSRFSPPSPSHPLDPRIPDELASNLSGELAVDVRLSIDKTGSVTNTQVLQGAGTQFASIALNNVGATPWEPARDGDHRVASDVIVHYLFTPTASLPADGAPR